MSRSFLCLSCLLTVLWGDTTPAAGETPPAQLSLDDLRTFTDVFHLLRNNYVDELGDQQLMDDAINGMLAGLDPHTEFLKPEEFREQDDSAHGRYAGIGVNLGVRDGRLYIVEVANDSPALAAGLRAEDLILAIDGKPVRGRPIPDSMDALHGPPGSTVSLSLQSGEAPPREVSITREVLPVPSVRGELLEGEFAYLQLSHFHAGSATEMESVLRELEQDLEGSRLQGIVLDLRENFGGVVMAAAEIADGFLDEGLVVSAKGRDPRLPMAYQAQPGQWVPGVPLAVLINGHSASAAEILAGALQDLHRATLVGETTFGKGTLQSVLKLRNGGALKLTTARYYTPSGRLIDKVGLEPDVRVGPKTLGGHPEDDWQDDEALIKAVDILRKAPA